MLSSKQNLQESCSQLCDLAIILSKYQNELQAIRQAITLRQDFHPQILFNHLSMGEPEINKIHISYLMQENQRSIHEEEIKILLSLYGYKDKLTYADFLNYIYPYDTEAVKTISAVLSKKYAKIENPKIQQQILALFIILIEKEVEFIQVFEQSKSYLVPNVSREYIKKMIKQIKKTVIKGIHGIQADNVITFQQFKSFLKKEKNINERKSQPICRRFSLQTHTFIGLDQLEIWLKPWPKLKFDDFGSAEKHILSQEMQGCFKSKQVEAQIGEVQ